MSFGYKHTFWKKRIKTFGWSIVLWGLMIQNLQLFSHNWNLNCSYNVSYTTTYLVSPPCVSLFLLFISQCIFFPIRYGFTSAACTLLCHVKVEQPWDGSASYPDEAASYFVINYPELQEHPLFNCSVKFYHILNKTILTPHTLNAKQCCSLLNVPGISLPWTFINSDLLFPPLFTLGCGIKLELKKE